MEPKNEICSGSDGWVSIKTLEECQNAVPFIKSKIPDIPDNVRTVQVPGLPKGCFILLDYPKGNIWHIYFNTNYSGSRDEDSREVCMKEGR